MTPGFTQWLSATFLDTPDRRIPSKDDTPPRCTGKVNCMERLMDVVNGEPTEEQEAMFRANINHCQPCYQEFDVQMAIRQAVKAKVSDQVVPADILDKIRSKISATA